MLKAGKMNFWKYLKMSLTMNPIFTGKDRLKTNAGFISKGCLKALALKRGMKTQKKRAYQYVREHFDVAKLRVLLTIFFEKKKDLACNSFSK